MLRSKSSRVMLVLYSVLFLFVHSLYASEASSWQMTAQIKTKKARSIYYSDGYIYIAEDGRAKKIEVKLGKKVKHQYEILDLPIGTKLIGDPYNVKNGQKIS